MQAITTKFLPWTNTLPSRIRAKCGKNTTTISTSLLNGTDMFNHAYVARKLCEKMRVSGTLVCAALDENSFAFVFVPESGEKFNTFEVPPLPKKKDKN